MWVITLDLRGLEDLGGLAKVTISLCHCYHPHCITTSFYFTMTLGSVGPPLLGSGLGGEAGFLNFCGADEANSNTK